MTTQHASTLTHIGLATTIAAGTVAYGSPIRFDNDGSFSWFGESLDITSPANDQYGAGSVFASYSYDLGYNDTYGSFTRLLFSGSGIEVLSDGGYVIGLESGDLIGAGTVGTWTSVATLSYRYEVCGDPYGGPCEYRVLGLPVAGPDTYLGVRLALDGATHYGWIGLRALSSRTYSPFAWGYETDAGVGVAAGAPVPAPGVLGLIAFGAAGALSRPKRRKPA